MNVIFAAGLGFAGPVLLVMLLRRMFSIPAAAGDWRLLLPGAGTAFVALVAENLLHDWFQAALPPPWGALVRAFLLVALVEELAKVALIHGQLVQRPAIRWRRLALLAAWMGAGFAGAENALYVLRFGPELVLDRSLTATPMHMGAAIVATRLLWMSVAKRTPLLVPVALAAAVGLHGAYDAIIFLARDGHARFAPVLALTVALALRALSQPDKMARRDDGVDTWC